MEKTVEAVICGHEITSAEVDAFIASLPREQQVYASHPDFRKQLSLIHISEPTRR